MLLVLLSFIFLCNHFILRSLRLIHQLVRSVHGFLNTVSFRQHATGTDRKPQIQVSRNICIIDTLLYQLQFLAKNFFRNFRHHKKEFIPAKTDQLIRLTDIFPDNIYNRIECHIPCLMSVGIIMQFKII